MISVVGGSGVVGRILVSFLDNPIVLATKKSVGLSIQSKNKICYAQDLESFDFSRCKTALFAAGSKVSAQYVPKALSAQCTVIDASSFYRACPTVPLIIPEINKEEIHHHQGIIASPNCTVTPMLMGLKPLDDLFDLSEVFVTSYQAVSGAGKHFVDKLDLEVNQYFEKDEQAPSDSNIAFNVIPFIDCVLENGSTKEEWKMEVETQKIFKKPDIRVTATCVRVPVKVGHSVAVHARFKRKININNAASALSSFPGIELREKVTPLTCAGSPFVYISRLRQTGSQDISFWAVCDNLLKGAALNMWQILEVLKDCERKAA